MAWQVITSVIMDTPSAVQLFSPKARLFAITFKARATNAAAIYIGEDSAAKSLGFEILAGDREDRVFHPVTVSSDKLWAWAASTGDILDYWALTEN